MPDYIEIDYVRRAIEDTEEDENLREPDGQTFTDAQIITAMERTIDTYAGIHPFTRVFDYDEIPRGTNFFLDGIIAHLYEARLARWKRNAIAATTGGVSTSADQERTALLTQIQQDHYNKFFQRAAQYKLHTHFNNYIIDIVG